MPLHALSLIKGEYGRNATLKRLDKQKGGAGGLGFWRGRGGCLKAEEGAWSQLRHIAVLICPTFCYRMGSVYKR